MTFNQTYCGFFSIIGRPNVGKSTLLNSILGQKISITSSKPQTTRNCIMGINTQDEYQTIYIDTPGLHIHQKKVLNRLMNSSANSYIFNTDLIIFVVEEMLWMPEDKMILKKLCHSIVPVMIVINKIDVIRNKNTLLPHLDFLSEQMSFIEIVPVSAKTGENLNIIREIVRQYLPKSPHCFPKNCLTNLSSSFMFAEIIREKLIRFLGAELPYSIAVKIERFVVNTYGGYDINGLILVERNSQKKIVVGKYGEKIKKIGIEARKDIQAILKVKVHLELWVKVKSAWCNNEHILQSLGYT